MKNRIVTLLIFLALITLNQRIANAVEPQEMGKHTFQLIKTIEKWNVKTYKKHMASTEEVYQSLNLGDLEKDDRIQKEWINELDKRFSAIREDGAEMGIVWKEIKYRGFDYKVELEGKINIYEGNLHFSCNEKNYTVEVGFLISDKGLRLGNLEDLREDTDKDF